MAYLNSYETVDWLALHLEFGSVYFQQFGGISRPHVGNCKSESMGISPEVICNDPH